MKRSGFLYILFLAIVGFSANQCTNETEQVDEAYKPGHSIEFPHDLHARKLKIDCKYCHNASRNGQRNGISAKQVCLKCHKQTDGNSKENKEN